MKAKAKHLIELLFGGILALLGFSGCEVIGIGLAEYGQPHADFKMLGIVKDEDGNPIEGIRVATKRHWHMDNRPGVIYDQNDGYIEPFDTLYTDSNGRFEKVTGSIMVPCDVEYVFEDMDGPENGGEFKKKEIKGEVKQTKKGDNHWYEGAFESNVEVTLEK